MMVDPILSFILDLRSFLTAVTTTAGAPTAVILSNLKKSEEFLFLCNSLVVY